MATQPFICIEGLDGVGKTTIAKIVAETLGGVYYKTPPPPYDSIRQSIDLYANPLTRFYFYLSAVGYASWEIEQLRVTRPVITDRYIYSTIAYHSAMDGALRSLAKIEQYLQPDCAILLAADEKERIRRLSSRPRQSHDERLETNAHFLMRVDQEFGAFNLEVIDTTKLGIDAVVGEVLLRIRRRSRMGAV